MSQCKVYLENYSGVYFAGSEIRGRIECYFDDEVTVRGIKIRIKCSEHNSWGGTETYTDPTDKRSKTRHITLTGDNNVLSVERMLFGSGSGSKEIPRGRHVYPFSYTLPFDIPSSYNGPYGSIRYKIKAIVDRPMRTDYEDSFIFIVQSPIDFTKLSPDLQDITTYSDEKSVCCWCCKGGDITMDVELPKTAFVAGEKIPFKIKITNLSNSNVDDVKVKFTKTITYKVRSPHDETKEDIEKIVSFNEHGVGAHGEHTYDLELAIPPYIVVPNFNQCKLFKVSYELKVSAEMPACTMDMDISAWDIQMGHIQCPDNGDNQPEYNIPSPGGYGPPPGGYAPPPGAYPPPPGGYPPPPGAYPPLPGGFAPPSGGYPPSAAGFAAPPEKGFPGGPPSAPSAPNATASVDDNTKAAEAARHAQYPSHVPEMPPPSYSQAQQNAPPYPPQ